MYIVQCTYMNEVYLLHRRTELEQYNESLILYALRVCVGWLFFVGFILLLYILVVVLSAKRAWERTMSIREEVIRQTHTYNIHT